MDNGVRSIPLPHGFWPANSQPEVPFPHCRSRALHAQLKILFLSGYGSTPGGNIPSTLRAHGHLVVEPDLPDDNFAQSVTIAQRVLHRRQPDVVIGWSRGGAAAMSIDSNDTALLLLAPAWTKWGTVTTVKPEVMILHSPHDDLISIEDSRQLLRNSGLPRERLLAVGRNHLMTDEAALAALLATLGSVEKRIEERRAA